MGVLKFVTKIYGGYFRHIYIYLGEGVLISVGLLVSKGRLEEKNLGAFSRKNKFGEATAKKKIITELSSAPLQIINGQPLSYKIWTVPYRLAYYKHLDCPKLSNCSFSSIVLEQNTK